MKQIKIVTTDEKNKQYWESRQVTAENGASRDWFSC